jgi:hypothetical protein
LVQPGAWPGLVREEAQPSEVIDMALEIDTSTGRAGVFVAGKPAWHRLGRVIDRAATSAEAIRLAGLDWDVEQWPLVARNGSEE